jgi:hypothetical protein
MIKIMDKTLVLDENVINCLRKFELKDLTSTITDMVFFEQKKIRQKIKELLLSERGIINLPNHKYFNVDMLIDGFTYLFIERYDLTCKKCIEKYAQQIKNVYLKILSENGRKDSFASFYHSYCGSVGYPVIYDADKNKKYFNYLVDTGYFLEYDTNNDNIFTGYDFYLILCDLGFEEGLYEDDDCLYNFSKYLYDYIQQ